MSIICETSAATVRASAPHTQAYLDKFTLFANEADFADSKNQGFTVLDRDVLTCKVRYLGEEFIWKKGEETRLAEGLQKLIDAVVSDYAYLL